MKVASDHPDVLLKESITSTEHLQKAISKVDDENKYTIILSLVLGGLLIIFGFLPQGDAIGIPTGTSIIFMCLAAASHRYESSVTRMQILCECCKKTMSYERFDAMDYFVCRKCNTYARGRDRTTKGYAYGRDDSK